MRQLGFFGEVMQEFRHSAAADAAKPAPVQFAGDTFNTAYYLQQLFQQSLQPAAAQQKKPGVHYFTGIGQDALSNALQAACLQYGLQLHGQPVAGKTLGSYWINTDTQGERSFAYQRSDSAVRSYFAQSAPTALEQALATHQLDMLYVSGISLAVLPEAGRQRLYRAITDFVGRGGMLVYDNNFRPLLWDSATAACWQAKLLPLAKLALLTDADERLICQMPAASAVELLQNAVSRMAATAVCILKCGAAPALLAGQDWQAAVPAQPVAQLVDTSGAGDSFAAAFLWAWLAQGGIERPLTVAELSAAAQAGHQLAAAVVQQAGAIVAQLPMLTLPSAALNHSGVCDVATH